MGLESNRPITRQTRIQLFICHSSDDGDLADKLRACIEAGVDVSRSEIRCTSADGGKLNLGDPVAEVLRRDLEECSVVIGVLTHISVDSRYVLMELGAAWMANKAACLLLAPGLNREHIPEPFQSIHVMRLNDYDVIPALLKTVSDKTERALKEPQPSALKAQVDFERTVKRLPCWRPRLVRALPYGVLAALGAGFVGNVWLPNPPRSWLLNSPRYPIHLYTGTEGGQFHEFGTWLADTMKSDEHAEPTVVSTQGSADNCKRIEEGANSVALAWTSLQCGVTDTTRKRTAKVIAALFPEVLHILVHRRWDTPDQSLPDLRGKKVYFGNDESGTRLSVERLLSKSPKEDGRPFSKEEITALIGANGEFNTLSFSQAADRLRTGEIDVAFIGTGLGAPAVTTALKDGTVRLVSLPRPLLERMVQHDPHNHYRYASRATNNDLKEVYEPNTYGLTSAGYSSLDPSAVKASQFRFDAYASDAVLLASEAVDKEFVEQLLETIYSRGNRRALLALGVSATYLDKRKLLNDMLEERGMQLNGSVADWESHCFSRNVRRTIWHLGGALLVFVAVTVFGALMSVLTRMGRSKVFGRRTRTLI